MDDKILCKGTLNKTAYELFLGTGIILLLIAIITFWSACNVRSDNIVLTFISFPFGLLSTIFALSASKSSITVTENKVFGKTKFGKQVDLPIWQISAVSISAFGSIAVATSSGKIVFAMIENRKEVYEAISSTIIQRQNDTKTQGNSTANQPSNADELKKYKELLDSGVISQEEFDAKKKQILGL